MVLRILNGYFTISNYVITLKRLYSIEGIIKGKTILFWPESRDEPNKDVEEEYGCLGKIHNDFVDNYILLQQLKDE